MSFESFASFFSIDALFAALLLIVGLVLSRIGGRVTERAAGGLSVHHRTLFRRIVVHAIWILFAIAALHQLGINLAVLLGAAGILSVALGFASQTSASNLISGLFLLGERPFSVGDVIRVNDITGEVLSVDLLSVKIRTFDNLYVRVPNEDLMKSITTTLTRFPIRRYDLQVGIAYKEDLERAQEVLLRVADEFPLCLDEPKPLIILQGFGDSSVNIQLSVWGARNNYLALRNGITQRVKAALDAEGIEIPFPHRTLYTGAATQPLPVQLTPPRAEDS